MFGDRPRVTPQEWQERVRPALNSEGLTDHQLDRLETMFEQSFQKNPAIPEWKPGIDEPALAQTMQYLRAHKDGSLFDDRQLDLIESVLRKYIALRT
ncbi:hypothetical protein HY091_00485 [Candidatus Kaiserbacteria bacterium]|nr:hypothetical protein [Candidatus Kaiserbacteria bacterium]